MHFSIWEVKPAKIPGSGRGWPPSGSPHKRHWVCYKRSFTCMERRQAAVARSSSVSDSTAAALAATDYKRMSIAPIADLRTVSRRD